jgi:GNAT superfamily N-acetyltransferase
MKNIQLIRCNTGQDFIVAKCITSDYMIWLNIDLSFQNTTKEYEEFSAMYSAPNGGYIYLKKEEEIAGGVAFRTFSSGICEMKRLFVYPRFQGLGIGKLLSEAIIQLAKEYGYKKMRLDTIEKLNSAIHIYKKLGFYEIEKYRENPDKTAKYMELSLDSIEVKSFKFSHSAINEIQNSPEKL